MIMVSEMRQPATELFQELLATLGNDLGNQEVLEGAGRIRRRLDAAGLLSPTIETMQNS